MSWFTGQGEIVDINNANAVGHGDTCDDVLLQCSWQYKCISTKKYNATSGDNTTAALLAPVNIDENNINVYYSLSYVQNQNNDKNIDKIRTLLNNTHGKCQCFYALDYGETTESARYDFQEPGCPFHFWWRYLISFIDLLLCVICCTYLISVFRVLLNKFYARNRQYYIDKFGDRNGGNSKPVSKFTNFIRNVVRFGIIYINVD